MLSALSPFQIDTEAALHSALEVAGAGVRDRRLEGTHGTYIQCRIQGTEVHAFIYADEAGLLGPGVDERFESADHETEEALRQAFVARAVIHASKGPAS